MNDRTENRIEGWDSKPLTGGFTELRELADGGFSGAARAGGTRLFMLNGRVVGVFGGSIEDFADGGATAYQAPHPSLPLLFAMQEYDGEQQAKYYTNDTPISEAHEQLSDAQFTGYIELSENVLSGDYYVVYYGGRSMSCAFVGNAARLETGDEAFELADDEVGIYEVMSVDIEVTDIPEPAGATGGGGDSQASEAQGTDGGTETPPAGGGTADAPATQDSDPTGSPGEPERGRDTPDQGPTEGGEDRQSGRSGGVRQPGRSGEDRQQGRSAADRQPEGVEVDSEPATASPGGSGEEVHAEADPGGETATSDPETGPRSSGVEPGVSDAKSSEDATQPSSGSNTTGSGTAGAGERAESPESTDVTNDVAASPPAESQSETDRRSEAAADRAVEATSGPQGSAPTGAPTTTEGVPKSEAAMGNLRPIPSLSPDHTGVAEPGEERGRDDGAASSGTAGGAGASGHGASASRPAESTDTGTDQSTGGDRSTAADRSRSAEAAEPGRSRSADTAGTDVTERASQEVDVDVDTGGGTEAVPEDANAPDLRNQLRAREERIENLEAAITDLRVQRDGLTDERDRLESEVARLEGEVSDLEREVERLRSRLNDGTEGKQRLSREDALEGTNLFIRYDSKGGGTLEKAHRGDVDREEVNNNLRLEHHTQFETDEVVVDGEPFDDFLRGTIYREFVEWVVRELLYEIQETGHVKGLLDLYDAIPRIDRAELLGDVSVEYVEDGEQYREQRAFDVVLRDRMGNPLIVANLNDSRNPADREMMETVIENGIDVKGSNESLTSSMMVTSSFFKPGALEAADGSAGGGLLSRDAKKSFVKVNRKNGYHLVLVESREGDFHVNVPEL